MDGNEDGDGDGNGDGRAVDGKEDGDGGGDGDWNGDGDGDGDGDGGLRWCYYESVVMKKSKSVSLTHTAPGVFTEAFIS